MTGKDAVRETRRRGRISRALVTALVVVAIGLAARGLAPQTIGEQVRRSVLEKLSKHYGELQVSVRRGHYEPDAGLILEDLRIRGSLARAGRATATDLLRVERMIVVAQLQAGKLLDHCSPITTQRIILDGVTADAWVNEDGSFSLASLWPPPQFGPVCPRIELRRIKLRLLDREGTTRPINIDLAEAVLLSQMTTDGRPGKIVSLRGSSDAFASLRLQAKIVGDAFDVRGLLSGAHFSRDVYDRIPIEWQKFAEHARDLDALFDTSFACARASANDPLEYVCRTTLHEGRLSHPALPMTLEQLSGVVTVDPRGVRVEASQAVLGDAVCRVSGEIAGHAWPADMNMAVSANGLWLDERLAATLPAKVREAWDTVRPVGRVDIDAQVSHSSGRWRSDALVVCKGVDVSVEEFPYPIQQLVGRIEVRDGVAISNEISGRAGGQRLQCVFRIPLDKSIDPRRSFACAIDGAVAIDNSLINSLTPRGRPLTPLQSFVQSLAPRGSIHLVSAALNTDASGQTHRDIDLRVVDGHLRYDKFAYPLYNVSGQIEVNDSLVKLVGFRATNTNAGVVRCSGTYQMPVKPKVSVQPALPSPTTVAASTYRLTDQQETPSRLKLEFQASNVPMDESLRSSLPVTTQQTWDALSPSGVLDELTVRLTQNGHDAPLLLEIAAEQIEQEQLTNRTLSLRPVAIPYRLDIAGGRVHFDGSKVVIDSLEGRHDFSRLSADGLCQQNANGQWQLDLNVNTGSRLNPDAELIASLPGQMSESLRRLQLRGPVSIRGKTSVLLPTTARPNPAIDWDLVLQLEGNRIGDVGPVHSMRGEISIDGRRDDSGLFAAGVVRIDSMHIYDLQLTGIRGPYAIDGDRLRLGTLATTRLPQQAADFPNLATQSTSLDQLGVGALATSNSEVSPIRGEIFDGAIELDGEVLLASSDFDVNVTLKDAKLPTVLAELGHADANLTGTISGQGRFDGKLGASDLLKGNGNARLTGANLYQLPFIVQLLNQLRITPTEDVAFTDGEVEYSIFGDMITMSRLQIWGDLVALEGGGTLNRRHELDLSFNSRVSPHNTFTRLIKPLGPQRYTLWTIDVQGPIDSPTIQRRALDGVGQTLDGVSRRLGQWLR